MTRGGVVAAVVAFVIVTAVVYYPPYSRDSDYVDPPTSTTTTRPKPLGEAYEMSDLFEMIGVAPEAPESQPATTITTTTIPIASPFTQQEIDFLNAVYSALGERRRVSMKGVHPSGEGYVGWHAIGEIETSLSRLWAAESFCDAHRSDDWTWWEYKKRDDVSDDQRTFVLLALAYVCPR